MGEIIDWKSGSGISKSDLTIHGKNKVIHYADLYKMPEIISLENIINKSNSNAGEIINSNSLLFPKSDVTPIGLARTSSINIDNVYAGNDVLIGKINDDNSSDFLSLQINRNKNNILRYITGSTVRHISSKSLSKLPIGLANLKEQKKISRLLNAINNAITFNEYKHQKTKIIQNQNTIAHIKIFRFEANYAVKKI